MKETVLYKKLGKGNVKCLSCAWYCNIQSGKIGVCKTRINKNGKLYSLVYGKAIGLHLDPVEKKPLYHFFPGGTLLSFGTAGCNFGCLFCQNYDMSQIAKKEPSQKSINTISTNITPQEIVEMALETKATGIAYTYNEPAIFAEYAFDTMKLAKKKGLKNVFVSNGFESIETFNMIRNHLDAINIDLKSIRNDFYLKICNSKISPVLANIKKFFEANIETEVTTLVIPGHNDTEKEFQDIAKFLVNISADIPWHISVFFPSYKMNDILPTPLSTLVSAYLMGKKEGLKYIYFGNVNNPEHSSTFCPKCQNLLISRINYKTEIIGLNIKKGICKKCGEAIYGRFS